ncbi:MAG: hypothetical protein ABGZ53_29210 [Fuerstiella sp.]
MHAVLFLLAIVSLILIPLAPKLVRLRIRFLRWLRWDWAVNLAEKYFDGRVLIFRIILLVIAIVLFYTGWEDLAETSGRFQQ